MNPRAGVAVFRAVMAREEAAEVEWQDRALCAETDPEAFFPEKGGSVREAKRVCGACEVRAECLDYALRTGQAFGIWGGLSERERRRLKRGRAASFVSTSRDEPAPRPEPLSEKEAA